jgi:hypothetical protein
LKKVQKTAKQTKNTRKPENSAQENKKKKPRRQNRKKQKQAVQQKKTGRALMGRGPYYSTRGRSEQKRARKRSIGIAHLGAPMLYFKAELG